MKSASANMHKAYPIGMVVTAARSVITAPAGMLGVVYEHYRFGSHYGVSILFANGDYDGFSEACANTFDLVPVRQEIELANYRFKHLGALISDYKRGYFKKAFVKSSFSNE